MKKLFCGRALFLTAACAVIGWNAAAQNISTNDLMRPLSLADCLNIALQQNATILKARNDLDAQYGVVVQTRAVVLPQLQATGQYKRTDRDAIESIPAPGITPSPDQNWNAGLQIVQSIYQGGKLMAAVHAAKATKEQALAQYQATLADTLLTVRLAYYDILLAAEQITVNEASVNLLQKELDDQQRRYDAGTVPHFNVLRAKVSVANARPPLIQAQNNYRIAKNNLCNLLGYNLPREVWENIPLSLTDTLDAAPYQINLSDALQAGAGETPRTGRVAQSRGVAETQHHRRQVRLQTEPVGLCRLQLVQRAIHAAGRTRSRHPRLECRSAGELGYF